MVSTALKPKRVDCSDDFLMLLQQHSMGVLNNIVTMDESGVSFHTPETKRQSKQWVKKDSHASGKLGVYVTQTKKKVLVFFDAKSIIYTSRETVNTKFVKKALASFLKVFREKMPIVSSQDRFLHSDNALVHTGAAVQLYLAVKGVQTIHHPSYFSNITPANFFLFPRMKSEMAGLSLTQESFQKSWEVVVWTIAQDHFGTAFQCWME